MNKRQIGFICTTLALCIALVLVFFVSERRAAGVDEPSANRYSIAVVLKSRANPPDFWRIVEMGIDVAAEEFGVDYSVTGPEIESDVDSQIQLVQAAIASRPDALILAAGDYERLAPLCEEAAAAGILLVMVDSDVDSDRPKTFIATDNYELGSKLAVLVEGAIGPQERFGVISHVPNVTTAKERLAGLMDNIRDSDQRFVDIMYCESVPQVAKAQAIAMLKAHPDIKCMVGLNESSALGIAQAIFELQLSGEVQVVACDSSQEQVQFMENGTIQACVVQNPFNMGYLSVQAACDLLRGKRVDEFINTGSVVVTKDDMYKKENQKLLFPFTDEG